jgi:hypothetical protein
MSLFENKTIWSALFSFLGAHVCAPFVCMFSVANEQLPEDGQIRLKHVATECDFNVILN